VRFFALLGRRKAEKEGRERNSTLSPLSHLLTARLISFHDQLLKEKKEKKEGSCQNITPPPPISVACKKEIQTGEKGKKKKKKEKELPTFFSNHIRFTFP